MSDLPFQWDDGTFISPFVAASEDDMEAFAGWLTARHLANLTTPSRQPEMRLTDLGCGDATALLSLAQFVQRGWSELQAAVAASAQRTLHLLVTGVELDESLLVEAEENAAAFAAAVAAAVASPTSSPVAVTAHFVNADIRFADLDVYFPRRLPQSFSAVVSPPYVLYMYLLPDALVMLREKLVEVLQRGWVVASNRWPIPGLDETLKERVGHVHIYYY